MALAWERIETQGMDAMGVFNNLAEAAGLRRLPPQVDAGGVYSCSGPNGTIERATVLSISQDHRGIPHVTYRVVVGRDDVAWLSSQRTLTLASFAQRYRDSGSSN